MALLAKLSNGTTVEIPDSERTKNEIWSRVMRLGIF